MIYFLLGVYWTGDYISLKGFTINWLIYLTNLLISIIVFQELLLPGVSFDSEGC